MKNTFIMYTDWMAHIKWLNMEQRGVLLTAIMSYQMGENVPEMDGAVNMAFSFICADMERNNAKYEAICEKLREAGLKGGRPKKVEELKAKIIEEAEQAEKQKKQKVNTESKKNKCKVPYAEIIGYLNEACGTRYTETAKATQRLINARFNEGFTLEDFKQVIDIKAAEWLGDAKMNAFLRPETLFGTKFESYLNQKQVKKASAAKSEADYLQGWEDV